MNISITPYQLLFRKPAGTSRGVLNTKETWFVKVYDEDSPSQFGLGEINMFKGLSFDDRPDFYEMLAQIQSHPADFLADYHQILKDFPAIRFGLETALLDFSRQQNHILFPSAFTQGLEGIPINGLIWMGQPDFMLSQIREKIEKGFRCLKLKIGAIDFDTELSILKSIRQEFSEDRLELRVDANGAFSPNEALSKFHQLSVFKLHSIEQPIRQGQAEIMRKLCNETPIPIALDEELIGVIECAEKVQLLEFIKPQFIILKPALTGGFRASEAWINLAKAQQIGWWITSALESNIGLNAIAQWTFSLGTTQYQGLGTGQLYQNNINSPLTIEGEKLFYIPRKPWETEAPFCGFNGNQKQSTI
jgi:o-succinylbenzoate synthase